MKANELKTIVHPSRAFWKRIGLIVALSWLMQAVLFSQAIEQQTVAYCTKMPPAATPGVWYQDTLHKQIWFLRAEGHVITLFDYRQFILWNDHVIIEEDDGTFDVANPKKKFIASRVDRCLITDSILVIFDKTYQMILDARGKRLAYSHCPSTLKSFFNQPKVLGQTVFCIPQSFPNQTRYNCAGVRNWGMITTDGTWVIAPQYDAAFSFQNGIAEVIHYGEKRKINENGEFVDEWKMEN